MERANKMKKKAYLVLENGAVFEGECAGPAAEATGEAVFHTGAVAYPATLRDAGLAGQIVVQTFPTVGIPGVTEEDLKTGRPSPLAGYVIREACETPSNFRCAGTLSAYLEKLKLPCVCGVDTREITRILRESGPQNAAILLKRPEKGFSLPPLSQQKAPTGGKKRKLTPEKPNGLRAVVLDCGISDLPAEELLARGFTVCVLPYDSGKDAVIAEKPDVILLSDGPEFFIGGTLTREIGGLIGKVPFFATGQGHLIVAKALGGKIERMKTGHRGGNQAVVETATGMIYPAAQNHGFKVDAGPLGGKAVVTFVNGNDGSCEGLFYPEENCETVAFRPETTDEPRQTGLFFDRMLEAAVKHAQGGKNNA